MFKRDRKGIERIDIYEQYLKQLLVILFVNIPGYGKIVTVVQTELWKEGGGTIV